MNGWRLPVDWPIAVAAILLSILSLATIYTITFTTVGPSLAKSQAIYLGIGLVLFVMVTRIDYRATRGVAWGFVTASLLASIILLPKVAERVPFVVCEFSSCRWIDLGFFRFQVAEVVKLAVIVLIAHIVAIRRGTLAWWHGVGLGLVVAAAAFMVSQQPDLGSAIVIIVTGLATLAAGRLPRWFWIVVVVAAVAAAPVVWQNLKPYQKKRIEIFFNPESDPSQTGYNVRQAEIAVGSGGLFGQGFGQGSQSQLNFLPVAHTDFIFAGYAEATGFAGAIVLIGLYATVVVRGVSIAAHSRDTYGRVVCLGIVAMIGAQTTINIGMNIQLLPVTGVPLPLLSYGGTSVLVTWVSLGLLESVHRLSRARAN